MGWRLKGLIGEGLLRCISEGRLDFFDCCSGIARSGISTKECARPDFALTENEKTFTHA
ncbi:hypothetical protein [Paracoccus sp. S3-43]|uniref:hypothetical protein n=1 Tax=Paracoccus sp. S3-43 TaxID=3030011 RepID=UPI0023B08A96|nr:hypothetical protein [Paracoccus sp. S3-43]WEF24747.1 hypothetical protein PXD02_01965 [Paracoccus sp. S3-43]